MSDWMDAEQHAERAHQYYEAGQWERALDELKLALAVNPQQPEWHFGMGLTLDALERFDEAAACFEQALRLRGEDADTLLHLAVDLIRTGKPRRAVETLERVEKLDSNCEPAYCHRILAYGQLGEHEQAEAMFYLARQIVDECPHCYDHMAQSLAVRGELDRAIWCWQQALKLDPHFPDAHANLGRAHWHRGQLEKARQLFVLQLREDPGDIDTLLELGNLLIQMNRHAEASEKFRRALELEPNEAQAHLHLGELSLMGGHLDAAVVELEMAGRLDIELAGVNLCLAQVAHQRGNGDEARRLMAIELDRQGHSPLQLLETGRMLIETRLLDQAETWLTRMIEGPDAAVFDDERTATAHLYRGVARILAGRIPDGVRDCHRSARLLPDNALAMHNLAVAYLETGRFRRARVWVRKAARLRPDDPDLRILTRKLRWRRLLAFLRLRS